MFEYCCHVFLIKVFEYYCIHDKRQYLLIAEFLFLVLSFWLLFDVPTFTCTGVYPIGGTSGYTDVDNDSIAGSSLGGSTMELLRARKNPRGFPGKWNRYFKAEKIFGIPYSLIFIQCAKCFWLLKFCHFNLITKSIFNCQEFNNCNTKKNWSAYHCFEIKMQKCILNLQNKTNYKVNKSSLTD